MNARHRAQGRNFLVNLFNWFGFDDALREWRSLSSSDCCLSPMSFCVPPSFPFPRSAVLCLLLVSRRKIDLVFGIVVPLLLRNQLTGFSLRPSLSLPSHLLRNCMCICCAVRLCSVPFSSTPADCAINVTSLMLSVLGLKKN